MSVRSPLTLPPRPMVLHIPYNASDMLVINDFARLVTFSCVACLGRFGNCYSAKSSLGFFSPMIDQLYSAGVLQFHLPGKRSSIIEIFRWHFPILTQHFDLAGNVER